MNPEKINLMLVDDHQMFIDGIKALLRNETKFNIIAEAPDAQVAIDKISQIPIDIVITDISMPGMSGIELADWIKANHPAIKVLVLSMYNDQKIATEVLQAEAEGFILKNTGKQELVSALNQIAEGGTYYSREVLMSMMQQVKEKKVEPEPIQLTEREIEILQLICEDYSSEQIAEKLFISKRTVDTHRQHIYEKTQCKTIVSLIKFGIRNNLVQLQ